MQPHGSYEKWMEAVRSFRAVEDPIIRIVFAASLASALVKPAGIMPFVVHLWGRGGSGKTTAMMVASSIWGNPEGAKYRTIEIGCSGARFFENENLAGRNAKDIAGFITKHYGHFGRDFIGRLEQESSDTITALKFAEEIKAAEDIDSKQALAAALILTADALAEKWIFRDGIRLSISDILPYLITRHETNQDCKAFEYLQACTSIHRVHFNPETAEARNTEVWGESKTSPDKRDYVAIYPSKFIALLENGGYNPAKFIEWAQDNGCIRMGKAPFQRRSRAQKSLAMLLASAAK